MDDPKIQETVKKKTFSSYVKNSDDLNNIFRHMGTISKNVYNTTIYINNIYLRYKEDIFKNVIAKNIADKDKFYEEVNSQFEFFYNLHSKKDSVIKTNNSILYGIIKDKVKNDKLSNSNYAQIRNTLHRMNKKK